MGWPLCEQQQLCKHLLRCDEVPAPGLTRHTFSLSHHSCPAEAGILLSVTDKIACSRSPRCDPRWSGAEAMAPL